MKKVLLLVSLALSAFTYAQTDALRNKVKQSADMIEPKVIEWRRDFHEHPELGNRETRTAGIIAKELKALGYEVITGLGKTG